MPNIEGKWGSGGGRGSSELGEGDAGRACQVGGGGWGSGDDGGGSGCGLLHERRYAPSDVMALESADEAFRCLNSRGAQY